MINSEGKKAARENMFPTPLSAQRLWGETLHIVKPLVHCILTAWQEQKQAACTSVCGLSCAEPSTCASSSNSVEF